MLSSQILSFFNFLIFILFVFISSSLSTSTIRSHDYNSNYNKLNDNKFITKNFGQDYEDTENYIPEPGSESQELDSRKSGEFGKTDRSNRIRRYPPHLEPNIMSMGSKFWIRTGECPRSFDGDKKFFCPYPNPNGKFSCLEAWELCDGVKNCGDASDEDPVICMFYKVIRNQMNQLFKTKKLKIQDATSLPEDYIEDSGSLSEVATNKKSSNTNSRNWLFY